MNEETNFKELFEVFYKKNRNKGKRHKIQAQATNFVT